MEYLMMAQIYGTVARHECVSKAWLDNIHIHGNGCPRHRRITHKHEIGESRHVNNIHWK